MSIFSKKLDFLMHITGTRNTELGRALSFDASYISRIRSGKRGIPRNDPFTEPAALFLAKKINDDHLRETIAGVIRPGEAWPGRPEAGARRIAAWLSDDTTGSFFVEKEAVSPGDREEPSAGQMGATSGTEFFYGSEGKRASVLYFLETLVATGKPQTLLLYSDEDFSWMYGDREYALTWGRLMAALVLNGGRMRIVHSIERSLNEMTEALNSWLPLYASGAIEPFYCARVRDDVYHRTLFIAKGHSAIFSSSTGDNIEGMLNVMTADKGAVAALEREFAGLLNFCRPLIKIFYGKDAKRFKEAYLSFEEAPGTMIEKTTPEGLLFQAKEGVGVFVIPAPAAPGSIECPTDVRFFFTEERLVSSVIAWMKRH